MKKNHLAVTQIDKAIRTVEPNITMAVRPLKEFAREETKQNMRIHMWHAMQKKKFHSTEDAVEFLQRNIGLFRVKALNEILDENRKYQRVIQACRDMDFFTEKHWDFDFEQVVADIPMKDRVIARFVIRNYGNKLYTDKNARRFGYSERRSFHRRVQRILGVIKQICIDQRIDVNF